MKLNSKLAVLFIAISFFCLTQTAHAAGNKNNWQNSWWNEWWHDFKDWWNDWWDDWKEPDKHEDVPIDGGLTFLIGAGVVYGVKRARDARKKQ